MKRSNRREIAKETLAIIGQGFYQNAAGQTISIAPQQKAAESATQLYTPEVLEELIQQALPKAQFDTLFAVNGKTTLDSVRDELVADDRVLCLNFASARNPGGGFLGGSQAQEESIARATGLYPCLLKAEPYYQINRATSTCLYTDHMIYSPGVPIFKDEAGNNLDQSPITSVITAPAPNAGVVRRQETKRIEEIAPTMRRRIDMVLAISLQKGYQTLVLGAWGCGVFQNDPGEVAALFHELLNGKYAGQFRKVIFSVYSKNPRFIGPFQKLFGE